MAHLGTSRQATGLQALRVRLGLCIMALAPQLAAGSACVAPAPPLWE